MVHEPSYNKNSIAIIGYWCRTAGADSPAEFHQLLSSGRSAIRYLTDEELAAAGVSEELRRNPDYRPYRAILENAASFDNAPYRIPPSEARLTDPQHRQFLEIAHLALEHSGVEYKKNPSIGVFVTQGQTDYVNAFTDLKEGSIKSFSFDIFNGLSHIATNVAYRLGCEGPTLSVQAACSGSLVAVHMACQSLLAGDCDMALAGGVSIGWPQHKGYMYVPGSVMSVDGQCCPFSQSATGTVLGEGGAAVVLCRLSDVINGKIDAQIHGVIRGSAVNNDGSSRMGFTTPAAEGQSKVIRKAISCANVNPNEITQLETHGTGTQVGDAIELSALNSVFFDRPNGSLWLGSVKANIGHLGGTAGVLGLIKMVMSLENKILYPLYGFEHFSKECEPYSSIFNVATTCQPWSSTARRIGGVSSFGLGGSNAHVIVEEASFNQGAVGGVGPYIERNPRVFLP